MKKAKTKAPRKLYATVRDETFEGLAHGGYRKRGGYAVLVGGKVVWTENDTWQPLAEAERLCLNLAALLHQAYAEGKKARSHA